MKKVTINSLILIAILVFSSCMQQQTAARKTPGNMLSVPLVYTDSGHILISGKINGETLDLLVDTGADTSVLHLGVVEHMKLETKAMKERASGIGTSSYKMKKVIVPNLTINSVSYRKPYFTGVDLYHIESINGDEAFHGIIGGSFLKKYRAVIDYNKKCLFLKKP